MITPASAGRLLCEHLGQWPFRGQGTNLTERLARFPDTARTQTRQRSKRSNGTYNMVEHCDCAESSQTTPKRAIGSAKEAEFDADLPAWFEMAYLCRMAWFSRNRLANVLDIHNVCADTVSTSFNTCFHTRHLVTAPAIVSQRIWRELNRLVAREARRWNPPWRQPGRSPVRWIVRSVNVYHGCRASMCEGRQRVCCAASELWLDQLTLCRFHRRNLNRLCLHLHCFGEASTTDQCGLQCFPLLWHV